jgi:hypothetical protein
MSLDETLKERGSRYGEFRDNAEIAQAFKDVARKCAGWQKLSPAQRECIDMIFAKLSRVFTGDPKYPDNFVDIAGYAQLVANDLIAKK